MTAELGRAHMAVGELLDLQPGAIIELDREAGVPIDVLVNGTLFARGEVDAILGFAPGTLELRDRGLGHVVVNSSADAPWSQYFCCFLCGNREFVRTKPVATKAVASSGSPPGIGVGATEFTVNPRLS